MSKSRNEHEQLKQCVPAHPQLSGGRLGERDVEELDAIVLVDERELGHRHLALVARPQLLEECLGGNGRRTVTAAHSHQAGHAAWLEVLHYGCWTARGTILEFANTPCC